MLKAQVGSSVAADARRAGREAAEKASRGLNGSVAFVYGSAGYDAEEFLSGVREGLGGVPFLGCSSFTGVLTPEGFVGGADGFAGVMAIEDPSMTVGVASGERGECPRKAGHSVAEAALRNSGRTDDPDWFYMVAPPGEEESYLAGIQEVVGRIPFFGGSAADNDLTGKWHVYGQKALPSGVAVAFFWNKPFGNRYTGAYRPTGKRGIITKVDNKRVLREIDGKPALEVVAGWLGSSPDTLMGANLLFRTITNPLGQRDLVDAKHVWIRHPMGGNPDMSINVGNNLVEGCSVELMEATVDELVGSVGEAVGVCRERLAGEPGALIAVHCGGRRGGIGERIGEVSEQLKKSAGGLPYIGVFTFGEYGFEKGSANGCGGLMLSFMLLGK